MSEGAASQTAVVCRQLNFDFARRIIVVRGKRIHLTPREFELLRELVANHGAPLSHGHLLTAIWGPSCAGEVEWLRVLVSQLRKKIESRPARPQYIQTEPCIGYRLVLPAGARVGNSHE